MSTLIISVDKFCIIFAVLKETFDKTFNEIMKHKGSVCDFNEERDNELKRVYTRLLVEMRWKNLREVFEAVSKQPASRFYVSELRALTVIKHRERTGMFPVMNETKQAMFEEIWNRYQYMRKVRPDDSAADIIFDIVNSPAPAFYLTPGSTRTILYRIG